MHHARKKKKTLVEEPTHRCRRIAVDADAVEGSVRLLAQEFPHFLAGDLGHGGTGGRGQATGDRVREIGDRRQGDRGQGGGGMESEAGGRGRETGDMGTGDGGQGTGNRRHGIGNTGAGDTRDRGIGGRGRVKQAPVRGGTKH